LAKILKNEESILIQPEQITNSNDIWDCDEFIFDHGEKEYYYSVLSG